MTLRIKLSQLQGIGVETFAQMVADHARELRWHDEHHADPARDPYPAPSASPLVDAAVRRRDFAPDYTIEDDVTPTAEQKKVAIAHQIALAEAQAIDRVRPILKHRLDGILYAEQMAKVSLGEEGKVVDGRDSAGRALCSEHEDRHRRFAEIHKHAAQLQSDVADLKVADAFVMTPFPGDEK